MNKKTTYKKISKDDVEEITTTEVESKITLHIPDITNRVKNAKDEVARLEELLNNAKKAN